MHITREDVPVRLEAPGAVAGQLPGFGNASGGLAGEYFSLAAGTDIAPLLQGLEGDMCQAPHWGYMITGELTVTYADGNTEQCRTGDLFHWPPGHSVRVDDDAEVILFSAQDEHIGVLDHMAARLQSM